jgi:hypothetical protein
LFLNCYHPWRSYTRSGGCSFDVVLVRQLLLRRTVSINCAFSTLGDILSVVVCCRTVAVADAVVDADAADAVAVADVVLAAVAVAVAVAITAY